MTLEEARKAKRLTASQLKALYQWQNLEGHFFDYKTMRFFGDTMRNYGVRRHHMAWELYRRRPVKHGITQSAYFCAITFKQIPWRQSV